MSDYEVKHKTILVQPANIYAYFHLSMFEVKVFNYLFIHRFTTFKVCLNKPLFLFQLF